MKYLKLPNFLRPQYKTILKRLGKENDGGYNIPLECIKDTSHLYSFGMYDDWSFESDFHKKNPKANIIVFDKSVSLFFWFKRLIKSFLYFITRKISFSEFTKSLFTYFNYKLFFFKKRRTHIRKFVNSYKDSSQISGNKKDFININEILNKWSYKNFFLKIDIEGAEYKILDDIIDNQENLLGMVIEFHDCDLMSEHIKNFINKMKLNLVHIHVNNFGEVNQNRFPRVLELTFSKSKYNEKRSIDDNLFPDPNIDQPNNVKQKDLGIEFSDE